MDMATINVYVPNNRIVNYTKQKLIKGDIDKYKITISDFNIILEIDEISAQKN